MQNLLQPLRMDVSDYLANTPWDARALGLNTFEITNGSEEVLRFIVNHAAPGHYTVRVDPLASKKILHECGFYYCDTLLEPYCTPENLVNYHRDGAHLNQNVSLEELLEICHGAFSHGRFHRDFNVDKSLADLRYDLWLKDIYHTKNFYGLIYHEKLVGFLGYSDSRIVLHALANQYRNKGLARVFWSLACQERFKQGYTELSSSISASNTQALNLYISLGFKFRQPMDLYHILIQPNGSHY